MFIIIAIGGIMKLDHIAIVSNNIKRSVSWYSEVFNCEVVHEDESWGMVRSGSTMIAFVSPDQHESHIAFRVDTLEDIPCDKKDIKTHRDGSMYHYKKDPDGNTIEWIYWPK